MVGYFKFSFIYLFSQVSQSFMNPFVFPLVLQSFTPLCSFTPSTLPLFLHSLSLPFTLYSFSLPFMLHSFSAAFTHFLPLHFYIRFLPSPNPSTYSFLILSSSLTIPPSPCIHFYLSLLPSSNLSTYYFSPSLLP